jgi:hypothetical protein
MAIFKSKAPGSDDSNDSGVAASTHPDGSQTVDKAEDKVLPDSKPDEIAPIPGADGSVPAAPKPAPSATGYRVAPGKSVSAIRGDLLDANAEIGPADVADIKALVEAGYVVTTDKSGDKPERPQPEHDADKAATDKVANKIAAALKA